MANFAANTSSFRNSDFRDRFIPIRITQELDLLKPRKEQNYKIVHNERFINYARDRYFRNNYRNALRSVLLPPKFKILNFFPPTIEKPLKKKNNFFASWPCNGRSKPSIGPPEMILDLPDFDEFICHHTVDWSTNNCIAAINDYEVHLFYLNSHHRDVINTGKRTQHFVKWNKSGSLLAVGLYNFKVGIYDLRAKKITEEKECCNKLCHIFVVEWINENSLATGCSAGFITVWNLQLEQLKRERAARKEIINIVAACDGRLLASGSLEKNVKLWKLPFLQPLGVIETPSSTRALAWHPWKVSILAVGHSFDNGKVVVWNVGTMKVVATEKRTYKNCSVDALSFNPLSGELVVSYFVRLDGENSATIISVLADINNVVEELHLHSGPVRYLMWGKNGTLLVTAGGDEHLCMWNFFSKSQTNTKKKKEIMVSQLEKFASFQSIR